MSIWKRRSAGSAAQVQTPHPLSSAQWERLRPWAHRIANTGTKLTIVGPYAVACLAWANGVPIPPDIEKRCRQQGFVEAVVTPEVWNILTAGLRTNRDDPVRIDGEFIKAPGVQVRSDDRVPPSVPMADGRDPSLTSPYVRTLEDMIGNPSKNDTLEYVRALQELQHAIETSNKSNALTRQFLHKLGFRRNPEGTQQQSPILGPLSQNIPSHASLPATTPAQKNTANSVEM